MKHVVLAGLGGLLVAGSVLPATADAGRERPHHVTTVAVYGDAPYGVNPTDDAQVLATPAFIDSINADPDVSMVLHAGDIHSGKSYCTAAYDQTVAGLWKSFKDPLIYTPGDNEWTDCHKVKEGGGVYNPATGAIDYVLDANGDPVDYAGGDPVANLDLVRSTFFARPGLSLGKHPMEVRSQARYFDRAHRSDSQYVENVMWEEDGIVYVTVNIPGGSNNDTDPWYGAPSMSAAQQNEVATRTAADLRWIDAGFNFARRNDAKAVVIMEQADMWDLDGNPASHIAEYGQFVDRIASGTVAFGKPVLLINGDSHGYLSDNPLAASDPLNSLHPGHDVQNFHRLVVHGSTTPLEWIRLTIDPGAHHATSDTTFGPFSWERMIQA